MSRSYRRRGERHDYDWVLRGPPLGRRSRSVSYRCAFKGRPTRDCSLPLRRLLDIAKHRPGPAAVQHAAMRCKQRRAGGRAGRG
jgi:hypothetical protein